MNKYMKKNAESISKKIALNGLFITLALILSYLESLIPIPFFIPGMKLGLANLAVMCSLFLFDAKSAFIVDLLRIIIIFMLFGNTTSLIFSLFGGMFSLLVMILLHKSGRFGIVSISSAAGICHNMAQLAAASFLIGAFSYTLYTVILWFAGLFTGLITGMVCGIILNRIKDYEPHKKI